MDPIRKHICMKFSNIPVAVLDARERAKRCSDLCDSRDLPASERECQLDCKLGRCISEHTMWLLPKREEVNTEQGACVKATGNFLDHSFGCEYQNWPVISLKCNTPTHMYLSGGEDGVVR